MLYIRNFIHQRQRLFVRPTDRDTKKEIKNERQTDKDTERKEGAKRKEG